jgi:hypothetical protein
MDTIIVITAGARGTTHNLLMKQLGTKFNIFETSIKHTFKAINTISIPLGEESGV